MFLNILQGILFFRTFVPSYHTLLFIMAGIYLHVPFCASRCVYCDFYSTLHLEKRKDYIAALTRELRLRKHYLEQDGQTPAIQTVYIGGGTPSTLDTPLLEEVFNILYATYDIVPQAEITLEANPDDLTLPKIHELRTLPVNRLSIGVQTFDPDKLRLLHRRHNAAKAVEAVRHSREAGFHNLSIDLIYGLPGETDERWHYDLQQAIALKVEHISAYHLTYEEGTPLYSLLQQHDVQEVDEDSSVRFFTLLTDSLTAAGYRHYEISNFCLPGKHSRHNTSYWQGIPYLGCGPSAHSFNRTSREWNVSSLEAYLTGMENGKRNCEKEYLTLSTRYNECIMTSLRTCQGVSLPCLRQTFGSRLESHFRQTATPYIIRGLLEETDQHIRLTRKGIFVSDGIISDLMYIGND